MKRLLWAGLALSLVGGAHADGLPGGPKLPSDQLSFAARVKTLLDGSVLRANSKTWDGEETTHVYFGASIDPEREFATRISVHRWSSSLRLPMWRASKRARLIEIRSGRTVDVGGPGALRSGGVRDSLLRELRNAGWHGPRAVGFWEFQGLGLAVPEHSYAMVIPKAELTEARAKWRAEHLGKPLPLLGSLPRVLDRMLAWEQWELERGEGTVPFTLEATTVAPTQWRFHARDVGEFRVFLLSVDLPQLATFVSGIGGWGEVSAEDMPAPVTLTADASSEVGDAVGGLAASLEPAAVEWTPGRTEQGFSVTRDTRGRLLVNGDTYDAETHGRLVQFPTHPDYGRTAKGWAVFRLGGGLRVLGPWGNEYKHEPARHGRIVVEAPMPPELGYAELEGKRTYLVRRGGEVHALFEDLPITYSPARHGPVVKQPPADGAFRATANGYQVLERDGARFVLRAELPPAAYDEAIHGALVR